MVPEYLSYWGFARHPFSLSPDPDMLFLSAQHQEALMRLKYGVVSNKGGVLLISENAGDGKTSILRRLVEELTEEYEGNIKIAFIDHPTLTVNQMIAEIARQLGVARVRKEKIDNLNALRVKLEELHHAGTKALVIVDEGQMLVHKPDILQELRILLNFCVSDTFLLSFVFSGQKPLEGAVKKMPEFWQRLPVRFFLKNLDLRDTGDLIKYRVRAAGQLDREVFTATAIEGIHRFSQGVPRVICSIADLSLLVGHSLRSQKIDFGEVSQATNDMTRSGELFHYFNFMESKGHKRRTYQCSGCGKRVKATDESCPQCGQSLGNKTEKQIEQEQVQCPSCQHVGSPSARCAFCGFLVFQSCPRCQRRNPAESSGCFHCGYPLPGRQVIVDREFEEGLRKLGITRVPEKVTRRFPLLRGEGTVYMGSVAPRLWWGERAELELRDSKVAGSFFVTEKSLVFSNGSVNRKMTYPQIRNLSITIGEKQGEMARPRMSVVLEAEEVKIGFPVKTDRPVQLASLMSDFVTNKRFA
ncbi:MAG: AAA family ATPase [Acidobacteria bacterium]|nr:AAA family ATPase [Acidobacteriota bacterium]